MIERRQILTSMGFALAATIPMSFPMAQARAASTAEELDHEAEHALQVLYRTNPTAQKISQQARATLVFPRIIKAGLVFGGSYGEGVLRVGPRVVTYYNSISASWGLQAGAQSYGYVLFLMNPKAVEYINQTQGWELGIGPTLVVVNEGVAANLSTSTLKDDVYAFIFDQEGLMAGVTIEGTKISPIKR